ncbi:MAG: bifunctional DNA-formamidopyrimidine glycosylase/DNA-(apurinic or apyrimidinic site) lyase [Chloroflexi bacterium]|nr:bifunctional DNA-formamidopyrimidine glycosylase/DNA-(apurinic or apyrimidinic site) lyase [Chloroflexota bacterium]
MPELPEVETICRTLAPILVGSAFARAELVWPGCVGNGSAPDFEASLAGSICTGISRRGKYLLIALDHSRWLGVHLRMTGRLTMMDSGADRDRHLRAILHLQDGHELHFIDQRKFGRLTLAFGVDGLRHFLRRLGPEPAIDDAQSSDRHPGEADDSGSSGFENVPGPDFMTASSLASRFSGRRAPIKSLLLDQQSVAGLGNIYVDEALFRARIHPLRSGGSLAAHEIRNLYQAIRDALAQGIENRGTTLSDYRDALGGTGSNQTKLLVFRRNGKPCPVCGAEIIRLRVSARGTHVCPRCQVDPSEPSAPLRPPGVTGEG